MVFFPKVEKREKSVGSLACPSLEEAEFEKGRMVALCGKDKDR
jgi:hypothetical protein